MRRQTIARMYATTAILMPERVFIAKGEVFEATPAQAKQLDRLNAARTATAAEIKAADEAKAKAEGTAV